MRRELEGEPCTDCCAAAQVAWPPPKCHGGARGLPQPWSLATFNLSAAGPWYAPLILPLFSAAATVEMGHNVSWPCRYVTTMFFRQKRVLSCARFCA